MVPKRAERWLVHRHTDSMIIRYSDRYYLLLPIDPYLLYQTNLVQASCSICPAFISKLNILLRGESSSTHSTQTYLPTYVFIIYPLAENSRDLYREMAHLHTYMYTFEPKLNPFATGCLGNSKYHCQI